MILPETTTEILAALFGLYLVVGGIRLVADARSVRQYLWEFQSNGALTLLAGVVVFVVGAAVVAVHRDWSWWLAATVTAFGWIALAKGVLLLLLPRGFVGLFANMRMPLTLLSVLGVVAIAGGVVLLWGGVRGGERRTDSSLELPVGWTRPAFFLGRETSYCPDRAVLTAVMAR